MKSWSARISEKLLAPTDAASLGMFRILFGALMIWQATYYLFKDRYVRFYLQPGYHFPYQLFEWVKPLPEPYFYWVFVVMSVAAAGIMLGLFFRASALIFLLSYSYVFLLDKAYYNNHYYAIILLGFLVLMTDGHRWGSVDQKRRPQAAIIPYWQLFLLRAQILIIYFFGGLAKLNADWLQGEPMRGWLIKVSDLPVVGPFFVSSWAPYFFSWGGLAFDLSIGFLLWWRKTRFAAFLAVLFFNLMNSVIFHIGVFPFLMIAAATLYDDPDWPRKIFKSAAPTLQPSSPVPAKSRLALAFVVGYLLIQVLIPLRHFLIPGAVSWTEEGHLFAWHMKLRDKEGRLRIWVTDPKTQQTEEIDPRRELNEYQFKKMRHRPQFIFTYLEFVKAQAIAKGIQNPVIKVDSKMSLNGRPYQVALDPNVNFAEAKMKFFGPDEWILPLDPNARPGTLSESGFEEDQ